MRRNVLFKIANSANIFNKNKQVRFRLDFAKNKNQIKNREVATERPVKHVKELEENMKNALTTKPLIAYKPVN